VAASAAALHTTQFISIRCVFLSAYTGLPVAVPLCADTNNGVCNFVIRNAANRRGIACALERDEKTNMTWITCRLPTCIAVQVEMLPKLAVWLRQVEPSPADVVHIDERGPVILPIFVARPKKLSIQLRNSLGFAAPHVHVGVTSMLALEHYHGVDQVSMCTFVSLLGRYQWWYRFVSVNRASDGSERCICACIVSVSGQLTIVPTRACLVRIGVGTIVCRVYCPMCSTAAVC
jgi:hypothetical protein